MAASGSRPMRDKSVQIASISTTVCGAQKTKDLSVKVDLDGLRIVKRHFKEKVSCKIELNPPRSIEGASVLSVQLCKSNFLRDPSILARMEFNVQLAERILGDFKEANDHLVFSDNVAEFRLTFSMKPNATEDLIREGVNVACNLKSTLDRLGKGYTFINTLLSFGVAASEVNPVAKALLASVDQVNKLLQAQDECDKKIRDLVEDMADSLRCIADVRQFAKTEQLLEALEEVDPLMRDTANFISQYRSFSLIERVVSLSFSDQSRDELESLTRRFSSFQRRFDRGVAAQAGLTIEEVKEQLHFILDTSASREEEALLQTLRPGVPEIRRGQEGCMEDTRVDILRVIDEWIEDSEGPNLFWLHGHPGTGKSAISATVRARLLKSDRLGSSFFFRREDFASQSPEALWCSVAYDLARKYPYLRRVVVAKLKSQEIVPNITSHDDIFDTLIADPLTFAPDEVPGRPCVVVIDALDECGGLQEAQPYQKKVLRALGRCQSSPLWIKIFVASRNEGNIESVLGTGGPRCKVLEVGLNVTQDSSLDIKKYLKRGFNEIISEFTTIEDPWPTESDLQLLTDTAAGLFIWASTVLNLVRDGDPRRDLEAILGMIRSQGVHMSPNMDLLGHLYGSLLASKFKTPEQTRRFLKVAGTIISARIPLSSGELVELLSPIESGPDHLDKTDLETICKKLKSVLDTGSRLRFLHQSFVDFLINLPSDHTFHSEKETHEERLALACFATMDQKLHFNMGNIATSYMRNADISGLSAQIAPMVYYTCRFWATHVQHIEIGEKMLQPVQNFMHRQLMFWLEVMSIQGEVGAASASLDTLLKWKPVSTTLLIILQLMWWQLNDTGELRKLAEDALSFVRSYATPIALSAPHIYLSAFVFAPKSSMVKKVYSKRIAGVIKIETGEDLCWHPLQAVFHGHTACVTSVAFSHDNKFVISGADDRTARIWDVETHQQIGMLSGHRDTITSVAFSLDDKRVVSGSHDHTVRIWDSETHQQVGQTLVGHTYPVFSVAFSRDNKHIVSGSGDRTARIWDAETHLQIGEALTGHTDYIRSVAFSPDGAHIVSGSHDRTVRIWDVETHQQIGEPLTGHTDYIRAVAVSPDGTHIVSGSQDHTVRIWDSETQKEIGIPFTGHRAHVAAVAISADGTLIASGSNDGTIKIWDAGSREQIRDTLEGHTYPVRSLAFSSDNKYILSGGNDCTVRVWSTGTQKKVGDSPIGHAGRVGSVQFSPDSKYIVSGSDDHTIRIWDASTHQQIGETLFGHTGSVVSVAFSHDGQRLVSSSYDSTVRIWAVDTHQQIEIIPDVFVPSIAFSHDDRQIVSVSIEPEQVGDLPIADSQPLCVTSVAFSHDSKFVVSGADDRTARIWDMETQQQVGILAGHTSIVTCVAFSLDDKRIVSGSHDYTVRIWDSKTHQQIGQRLIGHTQPVFSVAFSPDGGCIVSGSGDCTVRIWDAETHLQIADALTGHTDCIRSVTFSPNGTKVVSGSHDHTVRIWDAETHQQIGVPLTGHTDYIRAVAFSPDGTHIVSGSHDHTIRIWDSESQRGIGGPFTGHADYVASVAFSPNGKLIASGSNDHTIQIWDAESREQRGILEGHTQPIRSVVFSPNGKRVASGGNDFTVRIWDAETHQQIGDPIVGHSYCITSVAFSHDRKHIVSGDSHHTVRIWDAETRKQVSQAFIGHTKSVSSVAFSPNGKHVASGSWDCTVRIWDAEIQDQPNDTFNSAHQGPTNIIQLGKNYLSPSVTLRSDEWLVGPDNERLLWIPDHLKS
ncbi:quinon protein alcohol dehydrogenase-like superfamily, partial [Mycena galopus ATCC 62051]